jgi:quercetin dioxygenase-like cupin family protein
MKFLAATASVVLLACTLPAMAADIPAVVVKKLLETRETAGGTPIRIPADPLLVVSTYTFKPGAKLPEHKHTYPRYAYVLAGTLSVTNIETGKSQTFKRGDFIVEMIDQWHRAVALGTGPVKLLVIDQIGDGKAGNVVLKE